MLETSVGLGNSKIKELVVNQRSVGKVAKAYQK
jgi:hypothetical protein